MTSQPYRGCHGLKIKTPVSFQKRCGVFCYRHEDKKATMETYWVPGVNNLDRFGRWAFAEFTEVNQIESDFEARVEAEFNKMIDQVLTGKV